MNGVVLRTKNLTKSFSNRKVVDHLCFEVQEGEIFGFLGPNGAGKSTTIRLMLSLIRPDAGDVEIFGKSVTRHRNGALQDVGALIEEAAFYRNLSARRNLQLLANLGQRGDCQVDEVLEIVGLGDRADDKVKAYSHGMKQRLGIAQALLGEPKLLVLDEPTSGLDPRGMKEVREIIVNLGKEGITVFLSSHLLHEVEQTCTSMAIINHGRLVRSGKVDELLKRSELLATEIHAHPLERAAKLLEKLECVANVVVEGTILKVGVTGKDLPEVTRVLVENGVAVSAVKPRTSLEDYFLSLTAGEEEQ